jgi:hypothetical protein
MPPVRRRALLFKPIRLLLIFVGILLSIIHHILIIIMEKMGLFISSGASSVVVRECVSLLHAHHYISEANAKRAQTWLPPAFNLLLLLGMKQTLIQSVTTELLEHQWY